MDGKRILHVVSHTHWDREWYMSFQMFRRHFIKLMDSLIDLFESGSDYKYFTLDGQVLILKDYLEIRPENKARLKKLIKNGRLLIGPWYSQPNDFMVSGEALIRNLMLGYRECMALGGIMGVCYLPDAFGNISQLPQIIRGFDMEDVVASRGKPGGYKTAFKWKGADGSECTMFYLCTGYGNAVNLPLDGEDFTRFVDNVPIECTGLKNRINEIISSLDKRTTTPHMLLMNGIDHAFAQKDLPEVICKINSMIPCVDAIHSTLPQYINNVKSFHSKNNIILQEFTGEQRDSKEICILPASQSTRSNIKIINNRIEGLFEKWMEPFASFAHIMGNRYPQAEIWKAWEYLLQNHAHDSMACSCIDSACRQILTRFEWAEEIGSDIVNESLQAICGNIEVKGFIKGKELILTVLNPLGWERDEVVTVFADIPQILGIKNAVIVDGEKEIPSVVKNVRHIKKVKSNPAGGNLDHYDADRFEIEFKANKLPSLGYKSFRLTEGEKVDDIPKTLKTDHNYMENEFLNVLINDNGTLDVTDKCSGHKYEGIHFFEDCGEAGNGFEHETPVWDHVIYSNENQAKASIIETGPFKAIFMVETSMDIPLGLSNCRKRRKDECAPLSIISLITLKAHEAKVDIETIIINRSGDHRLRVVLPTGIQSRYSYAEQPFDVVARQVELPDSNGYPNEKPSPVHPQLSFVDVSDGERGLMVANRGIYEYEVTDDAQKCIALTLLRCTDRIYNGYFAECEDLLIPEAQCIGKFVFNYSIIPHCSSWNKAYKSAYNFRFPPKAFIHSSMEEGKLSDLHSFIRLEPDALSVSAIKKSEQTESLIIRISNPSDSVVGGRIHVDFPGLRIVKAYKANLNEKRMNPLHIDGNWVAIEIPGKGLLTLNLYLGR